MVVVVFAIPNVVRAFSFHRGRTAQDIRAGTS